MFSVKDFSSSLICTYSISFTACDIFFWDVFFYDSSWILDVRFYSVLLLFITNICAIRIPGKILLIWFIFDRSYEKYHLRVSDQCLLYLCLYISSSLGWAKGLFYKLLVQSGTLETLHHVIDIKDTSQVKFIKYRSCTTFVMLNVWRFSLKGCILFQCELSAE